MPTAYIIAAARSPQGKFLGGLSTLTAPQLGGHAIAAVCQRAELDGASIDQVMMGQVITGGAGQAPARQASTLAGLPSHVGAVTLNKVCGSGLYSIMLADLAIRAGEYQRVIAGGMESMSGAPHIMRGGRVGWKYGAGQLIDALDIDGLRCAHLDLAMGSIAEQVAKEHGISRRDQDAWSLRSHQRALAAQAAGRWSSEIVPIQVRDGKTEVLRTVDECPRAGSSLESLAKLSPAFGLPPAAESGEYSASVTAGNSSSLADGAAAVAVVDEATMLALRPAWAFKIVSHTNLAGDHGNIFTAPAHAVSQLLAKTGRRLADIDLLEINEAFASQTVACVRLLGADEAKVNANGGAIALGHPLGASGARILVTLLHTLLDQNKSSGIATLCLGGGEAVAMLIERTT